MQASMGGEGVKDLKEHWANAIDLYKAGAHDAADEERLTILRELSKPVENLKPGELGQVMPISLAEEVATMVGVPSNWQIPRGSDASSLGLPTPCAHRFGFSSSSVPCSGCPSLSSRSWCGGRGRSGWRICWCSGSSRCTPSAARRPSSTPGGSVPLPTCLMLPVVRADTCATIVVQHQPVVLQVLQPEVRVGDHAAEQAPLPLHRAPPRPAAKGEPAGRPRHAQPDGF